MTLTLVVVALVLPIVSLTFHARRVVLAQITDGAILPRAPLEASESPVEWVTDSTRVTSHSYVVTSERRW